MKKIPLNKKYILLPENWDELTFDQKIFAFGRLKKVYEGQLSPSVFRLEVLGNITGYKPKADVFSWMFKSLLFFIAVPFVALFFRLKFNGAYFARYWCEWYFRYRPKKYDRNIINENLYRLSEMMDFAFSIQDRKVSWKRSFAKNPIPYIKIKKKMFVGKKFILDIAPFSNITAREFSDCFDLYIAHSSSTSNKEKDQLLDKIISILYPASNQYNENLVSDHLELISSLSPSIKFGIFYWFSGIVEYYMEHPYYSILFRSGNSNSNEDKIQLGMNEVILMIKKKGYDPNDNINDFFDTQLKILKDNLDEAIAKGVKIEDLASKTGLSITDINRLT